jgi:hypothetical protein
VLVFGVEGCGAGEDEVVGFVVSIFIMSINLVEGGEEDSRLPTSQRKREEFIFFEGASDFQTAVLENEGDGEVAEEVGPYFVTDFSWEEAEERG